MAKNTKLIFGITSAAVVTSAVGIGVGVSFVINNNNDTNELQSINTARIAPILTKDKIPFGGIVQNTKKLFKEAFSASRLDTTINPDAKEIWNNSNYVNFDVAQLSQKSGISEAILNKYTFTIESAKISETSASSINLSILVVSKTDNTLQTKYTLEISSFLSEAIYLTDSAKVISEEISKSSIFTTNVEAQNTLPSAVTAAQLPSFVDSNIPFNSLVKTGDISYSYEILGSSDTLGTLNSKITIIPKNFEDQAESVTNITLNGFSTESKEQSKNIQSKINDPANELNYKFVPNSSITNINDVSSNNINSLVEISQTPDSDLSYTVVGNVSINETDNSISFDVTISAANIDLIPNPLPKTYTTSVSFSPFVDFNFEKLSYSLISSKLNKFLPQELNSSSDFEINSTPADNLSYKILSIKAFNNLIILTVGVNTLDNPNNTQTYTTNIENGFISIDSRQKQILQSILEAKIAPDPLIDLSQNLASEVSTANFNSLNASNIIPNTISNLSQFKVTSSYSISSSNDESGELVLKIQASLPNQSPIEYEVSFKTLSTNEFASSLVDQIKARKLSPLLNTLDPSSILPSESLIKISNDLVAPTQAQLVSGNNKILLPEGAKVTFSIDTTSPGTTQGLSNPNDVTGTVDVAISFTLELKDSANPINSSYVVTLSGFSNAETRNLEVIAKFEALGLKPFYDNQQVEKFSILPSDPSLTTLSFKPPVLTPELMNEFPTLSLKIKSISNPNDEIGIINVTVEQSSTLDGVTTTKDITTTIFGFKTNATITATNIIKTYIDSVLNVNPPFVKFKSYVDPKTTLISSLTLNDVDYNTFAYGENSNFSSLSTEISGIRVSPSDPTIAQILITVKSNVLLNGQPIQSVYIQNIPGFASQDSLANQLILAQYIASSQANGTLIEPQLLPSIEKNLTIANSITLNSFVSRDLNDPNNPNISLTLTNIEIGSINPNTNPPTSTSVVATIRASIGSGETLAVTTYNVTIENFATSISRENQLVANEEVANTASRAVASLVDANKLSLQVSQLLPSDFTLKYPAGSSSAVPISDVKIISISAKPEDSTTAVLTIEVTVKNNSNDNSLNFGIATYTQEISGFFTAEQSHILSGLKALALDANNLIVFPNKEKTGVDQAIQDGLNAFTITNPPSFEDITFRITAFDMANTNSANGELSLIIEGSLATGEVLSSSSNVIIQITGFLPENQAILNQAAKYEVLLSPSFDTDEKRPTASQAKVDNFVIDFSTSPQDPRVQYEITKITPNGGSGNSVTVTIKRTVIGTEISDSYTVNFNGLATSNFVTNRDKVNEFISANSPTFYKNIVAVNEEAKSKAVTQLVAETDFTITPGEGINVRISQITASTLDPTSASISLEISTGSAPNVYTSVVVTTRTGFAPPGRADNEKIINDYLASPVLENPTYIEVDNIKKEFVAANSLAISNFALNENPASPYEGINQKITLLDINSPSETATEVTLLVTYELGTGENKASISKSYVISGFATQQKAANFNLLNSYINSGNLTQPTFKEGFAANEVDIATVKLNINDYLELIPLAGSFQAISLSLTDINASPSSETTGIISITASTGLNSDNVSIQYESNIPGFLTTQQYANAIFALNYRNSGNRNEPTLDPAIDSQITAAANLNINSFNINQPNPNPNNIKLVISSVKTPEGISPSEATSVDVEITIEVGSGPNISNTIKYTKTFTGFANLSKEENNNTLQEYINSSSRENPALVSTIIKEQVTASSITILNLIFSNNNGSITISQPGKNDVNLSISGVSVSPDDPNAIIVSVSVSVGTNQSNIVNGTYQETISGFTNQEQATNYSILNQYLATSRVSPAAKNGNIFIENSANSAVEKVKELFTISPTFNFNGSIISLSIVRGEVIPTDPTSPNTTLDVIVVASVGTASNAATIEYSTRFTQFASQIRQDNIAKVNNYIADIANRAGATLNNDAISLASFQATPSNFTLNNLPAASEELTLVITSVEPKSLDLADSLVNQKTVILTISVSTGESPNNFTNSYTIEVEGLKNLEFGINNVSVSNYINSSNLNTPVPIDPLIFSKKSAFQLEVGDFNIESPLDVSAPSGIIPSDPIALTFSIQKILAGNDDGTSAVFTIKVSAGLENDPNFASGTYEVEIPNFLSNSKFLVERFVNSDPEPTFSKEVNGVISHTHVDFLPSELSADNFVPPYIAGEGSTTQFLPGETIGLTDLKVTTEIIAFNDDIGSLTLKVTASSGTESSSFTINYNDFLTTQRKAVTNAPNLDYVLSSLDPDFKEKNSAPQLISSYKIADSSLIPENITYLITKIEIQDEGQTAELEITIRSTISPNISRTYLKTITDFLSSEKATNLKALNSFISEINSNGFAPQLAAGSTNTTASKFVESWNKATTEAEKNALITFNTNPQDNLTQEITVVSVKEDNNIYINVSVNVVVGTGTNQVSNAYTIELGSFQNAGSAAISILRAAISNAQLSSSTDFYFTPSTTGINKLLIPQNNIVDTDITFDTAKQNALATSTGNAEVGNVIVSWTPVTLTSQNGLTGELQIEVTLTNPSESSDRQVFTVTVFNFPTTSSLVSNYVQDLANREVPVLKSSVDQWNSLASTNSNDYTFNTTQPFPSQGGVAPIIRIANIFVNGADPSFVDFTIEVELSLTGDYSSRTPLSTIQSYDYQIKGFKKAEFQNEEIFRVQYEENGILTNRYFSQTDFDTKFVTPADLATITRLEISSKVASIANNQFAAATNLVELIIDEGLTSIGENAFSGAKLTSLRLPNSLQSIGQGAFSSSSLSGFKFNDLNLTNTDVKIVAENVFAAASANTTFMNDFHDWKLGIINSLKPQFINADGTLSETGNNANLNTAGINANSFGYSPTNADIITGNNVVTQFINYDQSPIRGIAVFNVQSTINLASGGTLVNPTSPRVFIEGFLNNVSDLATQFNASLLVDSDVSTSLETQEDGSTTKVSKFGNVINPLSGYNASPGKEASLKTNANADFKKERKVLDTNYNGYTIDGVENAALDTLNTNGSGSSLYIVYKNIPAPQAQQSGSPLFVSSLGSLSLQYGNGYSPTPNNRLGQIGIIQSGVGDNTLNGVAGKANNNTLVSSTSAGLIGTPSVSYPPNVSITPQWSILELYVPKDTSGKRVLGVRQYVQNGSEVVTRDLGVINLSGTFANWELPISNFQPGTAEIASISLFKTQLTTEQNTSYLEALQQKWFI